MKHFIILIGLLLAVSACSQNNARNAVFMNADYSASGSYGNSELSDQFGMINGQY